jgi:hypothetical protein
MRTSIAYAYAFIFLARVGRRPIRAEGPPPGPGPGAPGGSGNRVGPVIIIGYGNDQGALVEQTPTPLITETVMELIALGAAMAGNNEEAFQTHHFRLHKLGVAKEDMIKAVNIALQIKMMPHRNLVEMAEGYLVGGASPEEGCCSGGCCEEDGGCGEGEGCCGGGEACGCDH